MERDPEQSSEFCDKISIVADSFGRREPWHVYFNKESQYHVAQETYSGHKLFSLLELWDLLYAS